MGFYISGQHFWLNQELCSDRSFHFEHGCFIVFIGYFTLIFGVRNTHSYLQKIKLRKFILVRIVLHFRGMGIDVLWLQFLILVVDCMDRERIPLVKEELYRMLTHEVQ